MMADEAGVVPGAALRLKRDVDPERDHVRGGHASQDVVTVVLYGDYLMERIDKNYHYRKKLAAQPAGA